MSSTKTLHGEEAITMTVTMADKTGRLIPLGVVEKVNILIIDQLATFKFKDGRICKRIASVAKEMELRTEGQARTVFIERLQQSLTKYPGKSKEQIKDLLTESFRQMGGKIE